MNSRFQQTNMEVGCLRFEETLFTIQ